MKAELRPLLLASRLLSGALIIAFLYFGKVVFVPLALALLAASALQPFVMRLRRWRFPRAAAVMTVCLAFVLLLGGLTWLIGGQVAAFADELPAYRKNIVAKVTEARRALRGGTIEKLQSTIDSVEQEVKQQAAAEGDETAAAAPDEPPAKQPEPEPVPVVVSSDSRLLDMESLSSLSPFLEPLATLGLVALLAVMMLLQWSDLRARLLVFLSANLTGTTHALDDAAKRIGKFLGLQLIYNAGFGLVAGAGLWLLGVPYAALWGLCAALFRYVPYAGPLAAAALPAVVSLVTSDGWTQVAGVVALFLILELISNNFLEPWLYGSSLGISEIGIVVATVFWTFLWGPAGLVLATPLTVCLVVLGLHVPCLSFFARLLSDRQLLAPHHRLYERLVAGDEMEVQEIMRSHAGEKGPEAFGEELAVPALALARDEQLRGRIRDDKAHTFGEMLSGDETERKSETTGGDPIVPLVLRPACPFTQAALPFLTEKLQGLPVRIIPSTARDFSGQILEQIASASTAAVICLPCLHEDDLPRLLGTVKRIHSQCPEAVIIVARWDGATFSREEQERLTAAGATAWSSSLQETRNRIAAHAGDLAARTAPAAGAVEISDAPAPPGLAYAQV